MAVKANRKKNASIKILVVEDEAPQAEMLRYNLEAKGYNVGLAADGEEALLQIEEDMPDVVILDWMLPKLSGIEVCRRLRVKDKTGKLPILMLTARGEESDRIRGLETGADDYLVKPYSIAELFARVKALLRRSAANLEQNDVLSFQDLQLDRIRHRVTRGERYVSLGPKEYRMLELFLRNPGRVFSRAQLLDRIWGNDIFVEERTIDVHIRRLRKALNAGGAEDLLRTVRGAGYSLDVPDQHRQKSGVAS